VVVVSLRANQLKNDATVTELRQLADFYGKKPSAGNGARSQRRA
jgi:hypothetical protein